jgi:hypothetical protein
MCTLITDLLSGCIAVCALLVLYMLLSQFTVVVIRKKLVLTSLTSGGRSVGIVRLRTEATQFFL